MDIEVAVVSTRSQKSSNARWDGYILGWVSI